MLVLSLLCFSWQCVSSIAVSLVSCSPGHSLPSRGTCWRSPLAWGLLPMETWMWEALGKVFYTQVSWNWILPRWALPHCISAAWVFHVFSCSHQGNRSHLIPTMKCLTAEREKVFYPPLCSFLLLFFLGNLSLSKHVVVLYKNVSSVMQGKSNVFCKISSQIYWIYWYIKLHLVEKLMI